MPFPELLNVLDLAKLSQNIAPHVSAVAKEFSRIQHTLENGRNFTEAMHGLERTTYSSYTNSLSSLLIFIPLYDNVEERVGPKLYVALFFVCGVAAAIAQVAGDRTSLLPVIGAGSAISGVLGMYLVLFARATVTTLLGGHLVDLPSWTCFELWFLLQFLLGFYFPTLSLWAHAGAFGIGVFAAWLLIKVGFAEAEAEPQSTYPRKVGMDCG
jgi:hypothetical protein